MVGSRLTLFKRVVAVALLSLLAGKGNAQSLSPNAAMKEKAEGWLRKEDNQGFIANQGQIADQNGKANKKVRYLLSMPGLNVQLRPGGFSYDAWTQEPTGKKISHRDQDPLTDELKTRFHRVDIDLQGANLSAALVAESQVEGGTVNVSNELGSFSDLKRYRKVTYKDIYPGIDLEFEAHKGKEKPVEYNFIVHPGADASRIRMRYNSGSDIALKDGKICMKLAFGTLEEKIPASFTQQDHQALAVQYKTENTTENLYAFEVPDYDRHQTLVIDPTPSLLWSTYYGGASTEYMYDIDVDAAGNVYISGSTASTTGIATTGAQQNNNAGGTYDAYLAKFSSAGRLLWATYAGGATQDDGYCVATDGTFVYLGGYSTTTSAAAGNPISLNGSQNVGNGDDAFLIKYNAATGARVWGTYYGGDDIDFFFKIHISQGAIYACGLTRSTNLTGTTGKFRPTYLGGTVNDGLVVKFDPAGGSAGRKWATYLGGSSAGNMRATDIDQDTAGDLYVTGYTTAPVTGLTTTGTFQPAHAGSADGFLIKLDSNGVTRKWGTYYGGVDNDFLYGVKVDHAGNVVVDGYADPLSTGLVGSTGAYQTNNPGVGNIIVVAKFNPVNGTRTWGTYYGSTKGYTSVSSHSIDVDENNNILIAGMTSATDVSSDCSFQPVRGTSIYDALVVKLSPDGRSRLWATYFSRGTLNNSLSIVTGIKSMGNGRFAIAGSASAGTGINTTAGSYQPTPANAGLEGQVAMFNEGELPTDIKMATSTLTPMTQSACALGVPQTIVGNSITITNPAYYTSGIFYQWQQGSTATGPWTDLPGETFKDLTPPTGSTSYFYRRLIKVNTDYCNITTVDSSAVASVTINGNIAPAANANGPRWYVCPAGTVVLNGSGVPVSPATISSYAWYIGGATTAAVTTASYTTPVVNDATTFTLKVTDSKGCSALDQVTIIPVQADAGPDVSYCGGSGGVQIGTAPLSGVAYSWTFVSGTAIATALSCTNCAQPIATPAAVSRYRLVATVAQKNGTNCTTVDTVTITPIASPGANFAGTDATICKNSTTQLGITAVTGYTYAWTPGTYLNNTTVARPVFNAGTTGVICPLTYTVTASLLGCTFEDRVNVSVVDPDLDYGGQTFCGPGWVSGTGSNCSATYNWSLVSGTGTIVTTRNGGKDAYLKSNGGSAVFRRTTTVNGIICTSQNLTLTTCSASGCNIISIVQVSDQGCPKVFPGKPLQLSVNGITAADYNFSWSPASRVDNPTSPVVNIVSTGQVTMTLTVTNKYDPSISCSASLLINNPTWALPVVNLTNKNTCVGTAVNIGVSPVSGYTYSWSPSTNLNNATISNPLSTTAATTQYSVVVRETTTGCKVSKDMVVNVNNISFDAGPDRTVCNNGVTTLGTTPGGSYNYSWWPVNSAWRNGTGATDAQPQVLFAGADQTFTVTVTDPVTGCTMNDAITLKANVSAGSIAGTAAPALICPGNPSQLGTTALPGATYLWSPAASLSCTNCAAPVATPTATTLYTVLVSYSGCSTPVSDTVRVLVKPVTTFDFMNKTICPATGQTAASNIGVGGTSNPASIANADSYIWSPSTGLSCNTCPSPYANPQVATTYRVTVTFTNGCTTTDTVVVTPTFTASAKPDANVCPGATITLGLPAVTGVTYSWVPATYLNSTTIAQPTFTAGVTTTYTLTASLGACTLTDAVKVTVNTPVAFTITGNPIVCSGGNSTTLGFTPANANMIYQWTPITGVASPNSTQTLITPTGTQLYKLVQTDMVTGCSNSQQIHLVVVPNTIAATGGDVNVCVNNGTALPLTVTSTGTYTFSWLPSSFLSNPFIKNPLTYTNTTTAYTGIITDGTSNCQLPVQSTINLGICTVSLSGNIFHDANGYSDNTVNSSGPVTAIPTGMFVSLVDASNKIIATVPVNSDGTYNFDGISAGQYSVVITNTIAGSNTPLLPGGFSSTGANLGTGTGGGTNTQGTLPSITVGTTNVTNANISIQQPPIPDAQSYIIAQPTKQSSMPLTGTGSASSPAPLSGSDPEDGLKGTGSTFTVTDTSGLNGNELYYNGQKVVPGVPIPNYNPALLSVKFTGIGSTNLGFSYAVTDNAGTTSPSVSYAISWGTALPVRLLAFTATKVTESDALLSWTTISEQDMESFIVERSPDALSWITVGYRNAINKGTNPIDYNITDSHPLNGINYYRLRLNDMKGNYTLSAIRQLTFRNEIRTVHVSPNPSYGNVNLDFGMLLTEKVTVKILNSTGLLISEEIIEKGTSTHHLDLSRHAAGIYLIITTGSSWNDQIKLILK